MKMIYYEETKLRLPKIIYLFSLILAIYSPLHAETQSVCDFEKAAAKYPKIKKTLSTIQQLQTALSTGKMSFTALQDKGEAVRKIANDELGDIQEIACAIAPEKDDISPCLSVVIWGCEGIPVSIDYSYLANVTKTEEEKIAYSLQINQHMDALELQPKNFFQTCCGDFGCAEGVGLPGVLGDGKTLVEFVALTQMDGRLGKIARASLSLSKTELAKAKCSCGFASEANLPKRVAKEIKSIVKKKLSGAAKYSKNVRDDMLAIATFFATKLPLKECKNPGYGN